LHGSSSVLPEYVVLEVCSVIAKKVNKKTADIFLEMAFSNNDIDVLQSNDLFETTDLFISRKDGKLSFVDVFLLHLSDEYEIITLDKDLEKAIKSK